MATPLQRKRRLARAFERELGHDVYTKPHDAPTPHTIAHSLVGAPRATTTDLKEAGR